MAWFLAGGTILAQIAYPLLSGDALQVDTILVVVLFFLASVTHAFLVQGPAWALSFTAVTAGIGLIAESAGVRTDYPFGSYDYAGTLGPQLLGVPVIIPLAWTMMAYPALLAGRRLSKRLAPLVGAIVLASWDLFLDPQMVAEGHWRWSDPTPSLPGIDGIPVTNFAGWLLVALAMMSILHRILPDVRASEAQPALLLAWTWVGSVLGNLFWFDRPWVALIGGTVMGLAVAPYLFHLARDSR